MPAKFQRPGWRRQAVHGASPLQCKQIGETAGLKHVAHGSIRVRNEFSGRFRLHRGPRPDREDSAGEPVKRSEHEARDIHGESVYRKQGVSTVTVPVDRPAQALRQADNDRVLLADGVFDFVNRFVEVLFRLHNDILNRLGFG